MKAVLFSATLVACALLAPAAEAAFAAIAYSPSDNGTGWAYNYSTRAAAEREALAQCHSTGGKSCRGIIWTSNGCAALAITGDGGYGSFWATTRGRAEAGALGECRRVTGRNCSIKAWVCSG
jgi:hypothetical protein